mmetsp:Transcript_103349/g.178484  ORF Transcript_103349/g.178484 Transcript_103349/m.178484 type:complete len:195 (+) Transcript_103349:2-586(+)
MAFVFGLTASWCAVAVNRPVMTEIVDPAYRASVIAWLTVLEGSSGALFGAPVVGFLAERVFHYREVREVEFADEELKHSNAEALGSALLWGALPPWALCLCAYTVLHCTYARDVARATAYSEFADEGVDVLELPKMVPSEDMEAVQKVGHKVGQKLNHKATRGYDALGRGAAPSSLTEQVVDTQDSDDVNGDAI